MVKICYIILSHESPNHIATLATTLVEGDPDCQVVIHYDMNSPPDSFDTLKKLVGEMGRVQCIENRVRCGWGDFSLVQATLNAMRHIRDSAIACDRAVLISGACLPNRPLKDLCNFFQIHHSMEFIEINGPEWIVGGLREERYRHYHLLNQRRWTRTFRLMSRAQKLLRVKRAFPNNMPPRFGSQWWALTWKTCLAILDYLDENPNVTKFYKSTWIPDEMFFQTLVNHLVPAKNIHSRSLTFYHFNDWGMPLVFIDDHVEIVKHLPHYFVRKVCHRAKHLRTELARVAVSGDLAGLQPIDPGKPWKFEYRALAGKEMKLTSGHTRLFSKLEPQSADFGLSDWNRSVIVLYGPPALTRLAAKAVRNAPGFAAFGRIWQDSHVDLGFGRNDFKGLHSRDTALRDEYPATWLKMLVDRTEGIPVIEMAPNDAPHFQRSLAQSSHAIFMPVVPRQAGKIWSDLYWLLLAEPSDMADMVHSASGYEYVQRALTDKTIEPDIADAINRMLAADHTPPWRKSADRDALYKHGEILEEAARALPFLASGLTNFSLETALSAFPQSVRASFAREAEGAPVWDVKIGLDLAENKTVMEDRAKLARKIAKKQ